MQGLEPHPRRDSGLISALDGTEDWEGYCGGDDDEDSHSPFAQLGRKIAEDRNIEKRGKTPKVSRQKRQTKSDKEKVTVHVYLRKSPTLDFITEGNLTLSGWLAVSFGNDSFETRLRKGSKIKVREMFYMRIVESNGLASILLHKSDGHLEHAFTLQRDWFCDSREISSRIGNCVTVRSRAATIVTLLPVSVDDSFFCSGELVSSTKFSSLQHQLFVGGKGKVYAPDEQHDAVMYIRFSLDALIKTCGQWKSTN